MSTAAVGLRELHLLHTQLKQVLDKQLQGPRQIKTREQIALRKEHDAEVQKERLTTLKKTADQKALQMQTREAKILDLRAKLNMASSNREFDIIKGQIEADTMANSVLEDEILEILEKVDQAQVEYAKLQQDCVDSKRDAARIADEVAALAPKLEEKLVTLQKAVTEAERHLPDTIMVDYRRLVLVHGAGALAEAADGVCRACYVALSPQLKVELNSGNLVFCRSCGRLLYPAEPK